MKLAVNNRKPQRRSKSGAANGFTFTEMMVSMALFILVVGGCVAGHVCGLRMFQVTQAKLGSSDAARSVAGRLGQDIQAAYEIKIGQGDQAAFSELQPLSVQRGNAIQLRLTTDTNDYVRYFVTANGQQLVRLSQYGKFTETILEGVTNTMLFQAEDIAGTALSNRANRYVLGMTLQFGIVPGTALPIGTNQYYKSCDWRMKFTPRLKD